MFKPNQPAADARIEARVAIISADELKNQEEEKDLVYTSFDCAVWVG